MDHGGIPARNDLGSGGLKWKICFIGLLSSYALLVVHAELSQSQVPSQENSGSTAGGNPWGLQSPPQAQQSSTVQQAPLQQTQAATPGGRSRRWQSRPRPQQSTSPQPPPPQQQQPASNNYVVLGYNDLGMHCMNQDFSQLCILPPYNSLHAQVIRRGLEPDIIKENENVAVKYRIPNNTTSVNKTNFWQYAQPLFGVALPADVGLTGNSLAGSMTLTGENDWAATGIPVTPIDDDGYLNPYPLATIDVEVQGTAVATTRAVVPVSWEISCNLCHAPGQAGSVVDSHILAKHDERHGTNLLGNGTVLCASCHADPALGAPGQPGVSTLSHAMHSSHANRVQVLETMGLTNVCYACHPGFKTNCQRDVHFANQIYCTDCHGGMSDVGNTSRTPWVDEPRCADCHDGGQEEFEFEEPGRLFKDSHGHGEVHCAACHGSPHAITPALTVEDNIQAIEHQGHPGVINDCTVCHTSMPNEHFEHKR